MPYRDLMLSDPAYQARRAGGGYRQRQRQAELDYLSDPSSRQFASLSPEVLGTFLSSTFAAPISGLAGLATLPFGGSERAAQTVRDVQNALTYQPRGAEGQRQLGRAGDAFEPIGNLMQMPANATFDASGSPLLAAGVLAATEGASDLIPGVRGRRALREAAEAAARAAEEPELKRMGQGGSNVGTVEPVTRASTRFRGGRERSEYPGIYGDPRAIVEDVNVAPEDPLMGELFGVTRRDLSDIALSRESGQPDWAPGATPARPRGNAAGQRIMTPSNERRIGNILEASREYRPDLYEGMTGWYVTDPMYQRMVELMGPEEATRRFEQMNTMLGLSSPGADVMTEINRGSRANWLANQGRFNEFLQYGGNPRQLLMQPGWNRPREPFGLDPEMANLRGHAYHSTSQAKPMSNYLETGGLGDAAKVPAYITASRPTQMGHQSHYPVGDAHWARGVGLADVRTNKAYAQSATLPEMTTLAPWYRGIAQQQGMDAVPAQALQWGALARQTGVETPVGAPKLELISQAIGQTAQEMGLPASTVRDRFLMGDLPIGAIDPRLLAIMGAGSAGYLGGSAATQYYQDQPDRIPYQTPLDRPLFTRYGG